MFIRQTIDLGGKSETIDPDINQFGGTQTADRLVITLGKFSAPDIFDANKYAHDPRKDFLNWALIDTGTFDYAADAWAFTYGTAVEWYQGDWTYRVGLFDLPIVTIASTRSILRPPWPTRAADPYTAQGSAFGVQALGSTPRSQLAAPWALKLISQI